MDNAQQLTPGGFQGGTPSASPAPRLSTPALGGSGRGRGGLGVAAGRGGRTGVAGSGAGRGKRRGSGLGKALTSKVARSSAPRHANSSIATFSSAPAASQSEAAVGTANGGPSGAPEDDNEDTFAGTFTKELPLMMYGFGDDGVPLQETVEVVESALLQYLGSVVNQAAAVAASSLKPKLDERDIMLVVRKDAAKFARIKHLLHTQQLIKSVRQIDKMEDKVAG